MEKRDEEKRKYLLQFAQVHADFRLPELNALLKMNGLQPADVYRLDDYDPMTPYLILNFPSESAAIAVCERGVLFKMLLELWAEAKDYDHLEEVTRNIPSSLSAAHYEAHVSWSCNVCAFGLSHSLERQNEIRSRLRHLPFKGPVCCQNPDQTFWIIERHETRADGAPTSKDNVPERIYFGREVARSSSRRLVSRCDLKKRPYLGPTSMDNELSLVMANMALVRVGSIVLDPFAGTGSILLACSNFGAFCFGTDIDVRVLRGKDGNNVNTNFDEFGLVRPELVRCDSSMYLRHFKPRCFYDAIVCDPPYGIRAGARKAGSRQGRESIRQILPERRATHIPQTQPYPVEDVLVDLLDLAAKTLVGGGRLVYLLPTTYDFTDDDLPCHPCLRVVANSEQPMTQKIGRRLITMEKVSEYNPELRAAYFEISASSATRPFAQLREKIQGTSLAGSLDQRESKRRKFVRTERKDKAAPASSSPPSSSSSLPLSPP